MSWVGWSIGEALARVMSQTGISSRYRMHCSSGLRFSCRAWKSYMGSPLPRLALGRGGGGLAALLARLVCWAGWVTARWLAEGTVNLLMSPIVLAWSGRCDLTGSVVTWAEVVALFAIPAMTYCSWAQQDLTDTYGSSPGWCLPGLWSGHVHWVALLFLPCLRLGGALERLLRGWWVRLGFQ